jgi:hypothetical protein
VILALLLAARLGMVGEQTCPFPEKLLPYRIRDARSGKLIRSREAIREFKRCTGFPQGRPGYVIDHIFPLACGGADVPENMIWQRAADGKQKDKWERVRPGCPGRPEEPGEVEATK